MQRHSEQPPWQHWPVIPLAEDQPQPHETYNTRSSTVGPSSLCVLARRRSSGGQTAAHITKYVRYKRRPRQALHNIIMFPLSVASRSSVPALTPGSVVAQNCTRTTPAAARPVRASALRRSYLAGARPSLVVRASSDAEEVDPITGLVISSPSRAPLAR